MPSIDADSIDVFFFQLRTIYNKLQPLNIKIHTLLHLVRKRKRRKQRHWLMITAFWLRRWCGHCGGFCFELQKHYFPHSQRNSSCFVIWIGEHCKLKVKWAVEVMNSMASVWEVLPIKARGWFLWLIMMKIYYSIGHCDKTTMGFWIQCLVLHTT